MRGMPASDLIQVERTDVTVRYVQVLDELSQIQVAWSSLELAVGSLRGRRFIGAFDPHEGWYRACVEVQANVPASPDEAALPEMVIPGGSFVRVRLRGSAPGVYDEIAPSYQRLMATAQRDDSRPSLEHYRRLDEIDVLMPII